MTDNLETPVSIEPNPVTPNPVVANPVTPNPVEKPVIEAPKPAADETAELAAKTPVQNSESAEEADKNAVAGREAINTTKPLTDTAEGADAAIAANMVEAANAAVATHPAVSSTESALTSVPNNPRVLRGGALKQAEINLTASLKLSSSLTKTDEKTKEKGVVIDLKPGLDHNDAHATNLTIQVSGFAIRSGNVAEVHTEIMDNLKTHPILGPIFANHKSHVKEVNGTQMLHLDMNHLPIEQYVKLIHDLADNHVSVPVTVHRDEAAETPKSKLPNPPQPDEVTDTVHAATDESAKKHHKDEAAETVDAAKKEHADEAAIAEPAAEASTPVKPADSHIKLPATTEKLQAEQLETAMAK